MVTEIFISLIAVVGFGFGLWKSNIVKIGHKAIDVTMSSVSTMMDSTLDDDAKEKAVRRAGFSLILLSWSILWRFSLALGLAALPIFSGDFIGIASGDSVMALMLRVDYIIVVSVLAIIVVELIRRFSKSEHGNNDKQQYSQMDQFVHSLAFSSPAILKGVSDIEDKIFSKNITTLTKPPIFVTSLARGGTTSLLNALYAIPELTTHTYRDMPFLTAPILWDRIAGGKKRQVERKKRAHGDGLEIDLDSPEAFEEVLWKIFWPENFQDKTIPLWKTEDKKEDANQFINNHMKKIFAARQNNRDINRDRFGDVQMRYCSKNNANIARIPYLLENFSGCKIVIPVRRPECHAASLLRQHYNFLKQHDDDPFVLRYMRDIGHYEFGKIHKPIAFDGFSSEKYNPADGNYWLHYWSCAFREVLKHKDKCTLVFQDDLRSKPQETMEYLCKVLEIEPGDIDFTQYFHSKEDVSSIDEYDVILFEEAKLIYNQLYNT